MPEFMYMSSGGIMLDSASYLKRIGEKIRMAREFKEISAATLAKDACTKRSMIDKVEAGEADVTVVMFCRIADAVGVKPALLLP